jgi:predicted PurR-regulated permease PerM
MTSNSAHRFLLGLQAIVFTVAILFFGRPVLVPFIVAVLLTFLLRPGVVWLERHHVRRALAVGLVGMGVLAAIGGVGWILTRQLHELSLHVDEYRGNLRAKVEALQRSRPKVLDNFRAFVTEVDAASHKDNDRQNRTASGSGRH